MLTLLMQGHKRPITASEARVQGHPLSFFASGQPALPHNVLIHLARRFMWMLVALQVSVHAVAIGAKCMNA